MSEDLVDQSPASNVAESSGCEAARPEDAGWRLDPNWASVTWAVIRRLWPYLLEATAVPTAAYYLGLVTVGQVWGIIAASVCTYLSVGRRLVLRQPVPGLLLVASVGISVRLAIYLVNHSSFTYFLQPIAKTGATALLFAVSVLIGKPLVARFAADFCTFDDAVGDRPAITALFRRLTFLWAGAQLAIAAANLTLLLTVPVTVFVGTAAGTAWATASIGIATIGSDAVRTTRADGLPTQSPPTDTSTTVCHRRDDSRARPAPGQGVRSATRWRRERCSHGCCRLCRGRVGALG